MGKESEQFRAAIERIDEANRQDPNVEQDNAEDFPKELLYSQRMTDWLERLEPNASEPLRLAIRAQHICRWKIPRGDYPRDRQGYRRWRSDLAAFHAETVGTILRDVGYDPLVVDRVAALVTKQRLKSDPECQLLEDVAGLVFLQYHLAEFARQHDDPKLINILQKTWKKMSPRGHEAAKQIEHSARVRRLLETALA